MAVFSDVEFNKVARLCINKANEVADEDGFVAVAKLASSLSSKIIVRPLLVEAMLASCEDIKGVDSQLSNWIILLNSKEFPIKEWNLISENRHLPLSPRARNTIAHELVHMLLLRHESEIRKLRPNLSPTKDTKLSVKKLESEVEKISPLLLVADKALNGLLSTEKSALQLADLIEFRKKLSLSREVFINKLNLLRTIDVSNLLARKCLRNVAIGIGKWTDDTQVNLLKWPLFVQFEKNVYPEFLANLIAKKEVNINSIFNDQNFYLNHGYEMTTQTEVQAGTEKTPSLRKMRIELSVESGTKDGKQPFLFLIREI